MKFWVLFKSSSQKKESNIAFKTKIFQNYDDEDEDLDLNEEEMTALATNLKKFLRLNKNSKNYSNKPNRNKNNEWWLNKRGNQGFKH